MILRSPYDFNENTRDVYFHNMRVYVEIAKQMGVDAGNVGYSDAVMGISFLERTLTLGYPWVSANLRHKNGEKTNIPAYRIKSVNGVKIGVFGLLSGMARNPNRKEPDTQFSISDPIESAREVVKELQELGVDIIVALSGMPYIETMDLAKKVDGIQFIVNGGDPRLLQLPERVGNSLVFSALNRGKYLGVARVSYIPGKKYFRLAGEKIEFQRQLAAVRAQQEIFKGKVAGTPYVAKKIDELKQKEKDILSRVDQMKGVASNVKNQTVAIEANISNDEKVNELVVKMQTPGTSHKPSNKTKNKKPENKAPRGGGGE